MVNVNNLNFHFVIFNRGIFSPPRRNMAPTIYLQATSHKQKVRTPTEAKNLLLVMELLVVKVDESWRGKLQRPLASLHCLKGLIEREELPPMTPIKAPASTEVVQAGKY